MQPSPELRRTLAAAMARILPADPASGRPGAAELGAADYAAAVLAGRERGWQPLFEQGFAVLDGLVEEAAEEAGTTGTMDGAAFADAAEEVQDAALAQLAQMSAAAPRAFFSRLVQLTLEGCLADPRHGGNRGGRGWATLGAAPPGSCCRPLPESSE
ncbi:MAG TPA: gluconate 2-dehydrogenase subunit 3 family protein [Thermoanaerobaculia bacterium]|nr:gluconate 2-dehydrogenase subunit 3 family protein [Thermoanaerobaculia bacterium]